MNGFLSLGLTLGWRKISAAANNVGANAATAGRTPDAVAAAAATTTTAADGAG